MIIHQFDESMKLYGQKKAQGLLGQARKAVLYKSHKEKLQIARQHFLNALNYRAPRMDFAFRPNSFYFHYIYKIQTSNAWHLLILALAYIFMYLVLLSHSKPSPAQAYTQCGILLVFWLDIFMEVYHKYYQILRLNSKFQNRFYFKIIILILLSIDQVVAMAYLQITIRFALLFRSFLPALYDTTLRKNLQAMLALYKDILVFTFFYSLVIIIFAMFASRQIKMPQNQQVDQFTENYQNVGHSLFLVYALSSFQGYPDNQLAAIKAQPQIVIFFIVFILLNLYFFVTIPTSLLFKSFKQVRSKVALVDQIKQQNSLILAFSCLCGHDFQIQRQTFIQFLFLCFRRKPGYVDQITQIFMQVDESKNGKIQVTQFMQICKIMHSHDSLSPPMFDDWQPWINFRKLANLKLGLKQFVLSKKFKIFGAIFILFSIINCVLQTIRQQSVFKTLDNAIAIGFFIQLIIKLIGIGPENYFKDPWNKLDFFLITIIILFELASSVIGVWHLDVLFKLTRAYRIALLPQHLLGKDEFVNLASFSLKTSRMVTQMMMTIPIVLQFFPMYLIFFYIFGIIGIQIYSKAIPTIPLEQSPYNQYHEFSNFDKFIYTQFYMVQILVQGGWSLVAFDYTHRYSLPYALSMGMFAFFHFSIVLVVSSLIKGVTWEVYQKIQQQMSKKAVKWSNFLKQQKLLKQKQQTFELVKNEIRLNRALVLQNLISRQIFESKVDLQIINKMKKALNDQLNDYMRKKSATGHRGQLIPHLIRDLNIGNVDEVDEEQYHIQNDLIQQILNHSPSKQRQIKRVEDLDEQQIDKQVQKLLSKAVIDGNNTYTQTIIYPQIFTEFLAQKIKLFREYNNEQEYKNKQNWVEQQIEQQNEKNVVTSTFDLQKDQIFKNKQSIKFLTHTLYSLANVKNEQSYQKIKVISHLVADNVITEEQAKKYLNIKSAPKGVWLDPQWVLRKTFLERTSQKLVQKFQIDYFSRIYGQSFKQINKITIQPLLRMESKIIYCLRNILRYRQMKELDFFLLLNYVQDLISRKLLRKGSLFKFLFQIDSINETWFAIQVVQHKEIKVRFIKNGIWIWNKQLHQNEVYIAKDLFYWSKIQQDTNLVFDSTKKKQQSKANQHMCQKFIKMLYQSFQTLAMCLPNQRNFFVNRPQSKQYDLFCYYKNTQSTQRLAQNRFQISKLMSVILTNKGQRLYNGQADPLRYTLTDLKIALDDDQIVQQKRNQNKFKLDETVSQMLRRLQIFQTMDQQQKQQNQGLPHSFIVNLLFQIRDCISSYLPNFVYQVQNLLNREGFKKSIKIGRHLSFIQNKQSIIMGKRNPNEQALQNMIAQMIPSSNMQQSQSLNQSYQINPLQFFQNQQIKQNNK